MQFTQLLPGVRAVDHIGFTVPDLDEAHLFLTQVIGCEFVYRLGPYQDGGTWMSEHMNVDDRAVVRRMHLYRLGDRAMLEVFEYEAPEQCVGPPRNSDVGGHHVAIYVEDMDSAVAALHENGLTVLGEPTASSGASGGQRWVYFLAPWGMQFELVSYPGGKAFDHDPEAFRTPPTPSET